MKIEFDKPSVDTGSFSFAPNGNGLAPRYEIIQQGYDESAADFEQRCKALPDMPGLTYVVICYEVQTI